MASLNDSDADAFFQQGDEGTYSGGPGDSIPAGVVNVFDDLEGDALPRLTREQIERRDRYTKWVTGIVGALGVSAMLAAGIRAVGGSTDDVSSATAAAKAPVRAAAPPAAAPVPPPEVEPLQTATPEPSPPAAPAPAAPAEPVIAAKPAQPSEAAPRPTRAATADRTVRDRHVSTSPAAPPRATGLPSLIHSSPPTANFPD